MRVAIDAMGGDAGPPSVVGGVAAFLREDKETELVLVGREGEIAPCLDAERSGFDGISPKIRVGWGGKEGRDAAAFAARSCSRKTFRAARPAAQARLPPPNVLVCSAKDCSVP